MYFINEMYVPSPISTKGWILLHEICQYQSLSAMIDDL